MKLPALYPAWPDAEHPPYPLHLGPKIWMPQESPDGKRDFVGGDVEIDETVALVTKATIVEIEIAGEESRATELREQGKNLVVVHTRSTKITADLSGLDATIPQVLPLPVQDVLIKDEHY